MSLRDFHRFDIEPPHLTGSPAPLSNRMAVAEREPVITSKRGPRYVDHATCPMCAVAGLGVEDHGELMNGSRARTYATHAPGARRTVKGQANCLGSGMRL